MDWGALCAGAAFVGRSIAMDGPRGGVPFTLWRATALHRVPARVLRDWNTRLLPLEWFRERPSPSCKSANPPRAPHMPPRARCHRDDQDMHFVDEGLEYKEAENRTYYKKAPFFVFGPSWLLPERLCSLARRWRRVG